MKYCCLDIGNVLVHSNFKEFIRFLSKTLNITVEEANYFMNRTQKLHDLGLTNMSDELHDHFKIRSEVIMEELIGAWNDIIIADRNMLRMINKLKKEHGLRVALLSNVGLEHAKRMQQVLNQDGFLDDTVKYFSCNVGARKPTIVYYHTFLELYPAWQGCPYIDDVQENLETGAQFGFKTLHFSLEDYQSRANFNAPYPNEYYGEKLDKIEKFILDNNQPAKNNRWH